MDLPVLFELRHHWHLFRGVSVATIQVLAIGVAVWVFIRNFRDQSLEKPAFTLFLTAILSWSIGMCLNGWVHGGESFAGFEDLGGLWLSAIMTVTIARKLGLDRDKTLRSFFLSALAYLAISSVACFVLGCCDGISTQVPWAIAGPAPLPGDTVRYFHPTQLYSTVFYVMLFILADLAFLASSDRHQAFFILTGICAGRFALQYFKQNHMPLMTAIGVDKLQITAIVVWATLTLKILWKPVKVQSPRSLSAEQGYTLIEIVMVIALLAVLWTVYSSDFGNHLNAEKYEQTRARLETLKKAIIGDRQLDNEGRKTNFGYFGDMGNLPGSLANLVTIGSQKAWAYKTSDGFGAGWRGPYLETGPTGAITYTKDAWGNTIYYDTSLPATIRSYGADNAAGGSGYDTDMAISIPSAELYGTVYGYVMDGDTPLASKTVRVRYPFAGWSINPADQTSTALGYFSFSTVPFGVRSLRVTTAPVVGPVQIVVDKEKVQVPRGLLNVYGQSLGVSYTASTKKQGSTTSVVLATLASTYATDLAVNTIVVGSWTPGPNNLIRIGLNGRSQSVSVTSAGATVTVTAPLVFGANQSTNLLELEFDADAQSLTLPTITFSYRGNAKTDSVSIT